MGSEMCIRDRSSISSSTKGLRKAAADLEELPPATSGKKGHNTFFSAACLLTQKHGLGEADARRLLLKYNERCQPPFDLSDVEHKLRDALSCADRELELPDCIDSLPPLSGPMFIGYVPDFASGPQNYVLDRLKRYKDVLLDAPVFWLALYTVYRKQESHPQIADIQVRQWKWGGDYPRNWRRTLQSQAKKLAIRASEASCGNRCLLATVKKKHKHFEFARAISWGAIENMNPNGLQAKGLSLIHI